MIDTAAAALHEAFADAWRPRPAISLADWAASELRLPAEVSATPGPYDLRRYSYWRGVLDAADDPEVEEIVMMASTQVGKTTCLIAILLALGYLQPAPAMLAAPDKDALKELRAKVYAIADATPALRDSLPAARLRNDRWLDLGDARAYLGYAFNTQTLSGKSCRTVLCTEVDRWRKTLTHGDPSLIVGERVKAFHRSLIVRESTPSDEHSRIYHAYKQSDERRFLVPCPACGHWQELRFWPLKKGPFAGCGGVAGLKNDKGEWLTPDEARAAAHYLCETGCRIESDAKSAMVEQGRWIPKGQSIDRKGKLTGKPLKSKRIWGARLNSLYAETVSFGRMAAKFLDCRGKQASLQVFLNDWCATRFMQRGKTPQWRKLGLRLRGDNAPGVVPSWALFLTAAADPGKGYVRWTVRAWGADSTSTLVAYDTTRMDGTKRLSHLLALGPAVLDREWPLAAPNPLGDKSLRVSMLGVDVGYRPHQVHEWWRGLAADLRRRVRQVAGKAELPDDAPWRAKIVERSAREPGKVYAGGQQRWEINRGIYSAEVHDRWKIPRGESGAWLVPNVEPGQLELYLQEITNEAPVRRPNKRGRMLTIWEKIRTSVGNHYGDCAAYELAIADMLVDRNWTDVLGRLRNRRFAAQQPAARDKPFTRPDGRPFLVTERG